MRWIAALAAIICSSATFAEGVRFTVAAQLPGYSYKGRMSMEQNRIRIDITEGNHPLFNPKISIISREAGAEVLVIDHENRTYFQRYVPHIAGPLPAARGMGKTEASRIRLDKSRQRIDGGAERHVIRAEYTLAMEISGETLNADVKMEAQFDVDPRVHQNAHPWGLQYAAKTGFDRVDRSIARAIPNRLPIRQVVSFSRQIAGGPVITDTMTLDVTDVVEEDVPDGEFYAPDGYVYREPVFSF